MMERNKEIGRRFQREKNIRKRDEKIRKSGKKKIERKQVRKRGKIVNQDFIETIWGERGTNFRQSLTNSYKVNMYLTNSYPLAHKYTTKGKKT